jgi:hypothetical protein
MEDGEMGKTLNHAVINIDGNKTCPRCGEKGVTDRGICMACIAKELAAGVGPKTLLQIQRQVEELFDTYQEKISLAIKKNENKLTVAFNVELALSPNNNVAVQTSIGFVESKIKDKSDLAMVSEIQADMFEGDK